MLALTKLNYSPVYYFLATRICQSSRAQPDNLIVEWKIEVHKERLEQYLIVEWKIEVHKERLEQYLLLMM